MRDTVKSKWIRQVGLAGLLLVGFSTGLFASESPSIKLGQIEVKLGTPKKEVMAKLSEVYDLRPVNDETGQLDGEHWTVFEKGSTAQTVGGISFKNEELSFASRDVARLTEGNRADELADTLFTLLNELESTQTKYIIRTSSKYGPNYKSILFYSADGKAVVIGIAKGQDVENAITVEESIGWLEPTF